MTEYVPTVGDTATFIRKAGTSVRGEVTDITSTHYLLTDTTGHDRKILKGSVRKVLS